ncbi:MAG: ABC transporter permease [Negativicutes bacterium]|nr:ABC transporter permease [Negativicutes bacterium]
MSRQSSRLKAIVLCLSSNKLLAISLVYLLLLLIGATVGPVMTTRSYDSQHLAIANSPPTADHWFGTDHLGRDLLIRSLYGARISLSIGLFSGLANLLIGVIYGGFAGYRGGLADTVMMALVDILWGIPLLLYVILFMIVLGPGLQNVMLTLGLVYWLSTARVTRAQVMQIKSQDFIVAARLSGAGDLWIIRRHILPNAWGTILASLVFSVPAAIFAESFLSFIGLGVSAPLASWGVMCAEGVTSLRSHPYQLFFPAALICSTILSFLCIGESLGRLDSLTRGKQNEQTGYLNS